MRRARSWRIWKRVQRNHPSPFIKEEKKIDNDSSGEDATRYELEYSIFVVAIYLKYLYISNIRTYFAATF